jgi:hypothetical protein
VAQASPADNRAPPGGTGRQSAEAPEARTTGAHFATSARMKAS